VPGRLNDEAAVVGGLLLVFQDYLGLLLLRRSGRDSISVRTGCYVR
jgi:hypothetical protein